ncbi:hypothetical protein ABZX93_31985 [Streptomyces sp. NPDC006632]|uniref:hypothetical protein n=1 Tax=unclassified Streptomyces TaxID=2593676 RepID=UPI002E227943
MSGSRTAAVCSTVCSTAALVALAGVATAHADDTGSLTAQQIAQRSRAALLGATSLHMTAKGDLGTSGAASSTSFDLTLDRAGNCRGSVGLGPRGSVQIVKRGSDVWLKPDAAFWKNEVPGGGSALASLVGGRYLKGTTNDPVLRTSTDVCDLDTFRQSIAGATQQPATGLTKGKPTTVDGVAVIPVTGTQQGRTITLDVAATGTPYPVRITIAKAGAKTPDATIRFDGYDKPVPTATPPADQSVDISGLTNRAS